MSSESDLHYLLEKVGKEEPVVSPVEEGSEESTSLLEVEGDEEEAVDGLERAESGVNRRNLFEHPDTNAIVLGLSLIKKYGPDWLAWESETLEMRIPKDFQVKEVSHLNLSKMQAIKTLHLVDSYWQRWEVFLWCTMPFNGLFPDFEILQVPTVAQCLISVDTANRVRDDAEWSEEIKTFLAAVFRHDGIFCSIPPLEFVKVDEDNVVVDCADVKNRWPLVRRSGKAPPPDSIENAQLGIALESYKYLQEHQRMLRQQLPLVDHV